MKKQKSIRPFAYDLEEKDLKRERRKARELRESQWWKRRLAKGECYYCGGKSTRGNVVPCYKTCNNAKKQLLPMEWEQYLKQFS